ncbi:MAG: right-handed parallel beta-helix repeat-containing protein [Opitutae bacterium]|nr:right-handed parallel beta-helix repeat-containing protein [Opitutae bacterium]
MTRTTNLIAGLARLKPKFPLSVPVNPRAVARWLLLPAGLLLLSGCGTPDRGVSSAATVRADVPFPSNPAITPRYQPPESRPAVEFFVAPDGDDRNDGTAVAPLATLAHARDVVRGRVARFGRPAGGIAVTLKPGTYRLTETLRLSAADGGTEESPVIYRAQQPGTAVLFGGAEVSGFTPVVDPAIQARLPDEARGRVWQCDLRAQGITDYGQLAIRGFGHLSPPPTLELYFNCASTTLARWPNRGFVGIERLIEPGAKSAHQPTVFAYQGDRPGRWTTALDAWLFGYFRFLWADSTLPVARIDPVARTIATAEPYEYTGLGGADNTQGIRYRVFNLLEEIDEPGEWYLDRRTGILYLYPTDDPTRATVEISLLPGPMIEAERVRHLRFEDLVFDLGRSDGVVLRDAEDCLVAGCTIRRMAANGLRILGGHRDAVYACDIHTLGRRATEIIGGDRASLAPGGHRVVNCRIHDFGRIDRTYTPGIELNGVGHHVAHNLLYDCPSSAIHIEGNDHVIEFNEVRDAVLESDDQGAMELFGNPTYRGVIFRYNLFRDIGPKARPEAAVAGQAALRFDDVISGMQVYGNIFYRAAAGAFGAIQINSGRDSMIERNIFIECRECVTGGWEESNSFWAQIRDGQPPAEFYLNKLYLERYPELAGLLRRPALNYVWQNVALRCPGAWEAHPERTEPKAIVPPARARLDRWHFFGNRELADDDPLVRESDPTLGLDPARLAELGLGDLPVAEIGPYPDTRRTTYP